MSQRGCGVIGSERCSYRRSWLVRNVKVPAKRSFDGALSGDRFFTGTKDCGGIIATILLGQKRKFKNGGLESASLAEQNF
jgi:hypothetical protein